MYKFIYQKWWKILGLLILLYVFSFGFYVPLRPGLLSVSETQIEGGTSFEIQVDGYNTDYNVDETISAFLKYDSSHVYQVDAVTVIDRRTLSLKGIAPNFNSNKAAGFDDVTLIIHDPSSGYQIMPAAFVSTPQTAIGDAGIGWVEEMPSAGTEWKLSFPFRSILYETIRNTFFHVAIWMAMFVLLIVSLVYSIKYLRSNSLVDDAVAASFAHVAVFLGVLGMITGSIWARYTWGTYWTNDPKLNMSAVAMMIYAAYSILRSSVTSDDQRAKLSAAYNIFAFVAMIPLIFIIPRLTSSLHPGNGGNPALGGEDLDSTLRMVFYPAIIGYTLLGVWMSSILFRIRKVQLNLISRQLTK